MANWLRAIPQSRMGIVNFTDAFLIDKYWILSIASSFGNDNRFFLLFVAGNWATQ